MNVDRYQVKQLKECLRTRRKSKDNNDFVQNAISELKFFKEKKELFDKSLYQSMIKKLQLVSYQKGDVIFHYGSNDVDLFYIVYTGEVAILCPKDNNISKTQIIEEYNNGIVNKQLNIPLVSPRIEMRALKDEILTQAYSNFLGINIKRADKESIQEQYQNQIHQFQLDRWMAIHMKRFFPSMKVVNVCQQGESFGEIALIGNVCRTATVLCVNDCQLFTLSNPDFQQTLRLYHAQVQVERSVLLSKFNLFANLSSARMNTLIENIVIYKPKMFNVIYYENTKPEYLYFIKAGEVELLKILPKNQTVSIALLQVGCAFGYDEIKSNTLREFRAISKSNQCELYLIPIDIIISIDNTPTEQTTEQKFYCERLNRLLSERSSRHAKVKTSQKDSVENYKQFFDKEYCCITRFQKKNSIQHKKTKSEPFVPFFKNEAKILKRSSISVIAPFCQISSHRSNIDKSTTIQKVNIHSHLFSPKITRRQVDVMMPFKKHKLNLKS